MCYSPAPALACRQPGLVTVPALRAGVAWGPPSIAGLGNPPEWANYHSQGCFGGNLEELCSAILTTPRVGRGLSPRVCPHALGTPHCPQQCCLGVGTHHDLPLGHVALRGGHATSCPLPAHPAALRTITSPAPARSVCLSWGAGNEPPTGPAWPPSHPAGGQGCTPLGLPCPDPLPTCHCLHPGSACGGLGGWRGMCHRRPWPGLAPSVTCGDMSSFHCYSHPESFPLSPVGSL